MADGNLKDIIMPPQGNIGNTDPDWRAKFLSREAYQREQTEWRPRKTGAFLPLISIVILPELPAGLRWLNRTYPQFLTLNWVDLVLGAVIGILVAGILGYILQQIRWARGSLNTYRAPHNDLSDEADPYKIARGMVGKFFSAVFWTIMLILFVTVVGALIYGYFVGFDSLF